ncbi:MAG: metallophosphoesterase [Candidatus Krumholzibacteria bacterium]|nr:metallophosphoesterase [Candidatus Krumholzibacteria bacterium]
MRIAIMSDIHDNIPKLGTALSRLQDVDVLICCGDLCSPFIIKAMAQGFGGPIHIVFGNNDGDRYRISEGAKKYANICIHGEFAELELDGKKLAVNHFDNLGWAMAGSQRYDVVCFGHNHQFEVAERGKTLVINPGEIYGLLSGSSTFAVYDTQTGAATRVEV